jgi:RimJ/RimL family protein N-acetyltransferase
MSAESALNAGPLLLRPWRDSDLPTFAALNADPRVMEFLPTVLDRVASDAMATRIRDHFARHGFGLWAVEVPGGSDFIGFVGLHIPTFETHFTPCVEIGWRLAYDHWGRGHATTAARRALDFAFAKLNCSEVVSFTVPHNVRSRRVMERLGMTHDADDDFDHPVLPAGHPLRRHVLYRLARSAHTQVGA